MKLPKLDPVTLLALLAAGGLALWLSRRGVQGVASDLGAAVVEAAGGIVTGAAGAVSGIASGAVGSVGATVGLPTPAQTTTDARVARWIADNHGWLTASLWSGAPALFAAYDLPPGSGLPPAPGSPAGLALLPPLTTGDFSRLDRASYDAQWTLPQ